MITGPLYYEVVQNWRTKGMVVYPAGLQSGKRWDEWSLEHPPEGHEDKIYDVFFAHPTAVIDPGCTVGAGTFIWHFCHVMRGGEIGRGCNVGQNCFIDDGAYVGHGCKLQNNVSVYRQVRLEDEVFCGPSCVFTNVLTPRAGVKRPVEEFDETIIRRGATIGANATIICGAEVGEYAMVGAGSVVTANQEVGEHEIVVGTPARKIRYACRCGHPWGGDLPHLQCERCGWTYADRNKKVAIK